MDYDNTTTVEKLDQNSAINVVLRIGNVTRQRGSFLTKGVPSKR